MQLWTASNPNETQTWCECQHHNEDFLVWHRMYIWFFERVVQQASGDPNFRLPYWDYSSNGQIFLRLSATNLREPERPDRPPTRFKWRQRKPNLNNGSQALRRG